MQNRSMFPYRRQGPKKRNKNGHNRRPRGPQKPLPNSARELLPLLQPATKALAQVLAGRSSASGQFGHAQAVAAQADRLIAERAHNRLNPAEREEFFEQLARLKLTLTDAEAEAEVQAEEEVEKPAPRPPVAQERLMQMALSLTMPDRSRAAAETNGEDEPEVPEAADQGAPDDSAERAEPRQADEQERAAETSGGSQGEARSLVNAQSGRLQLSRSAAERAATAVAAGPRTRSAAPRGARARAASEAEDGTPEPADEPGEQAGPRVAPPTSPADQDQGDAPSGNGSTAGRRARKSKPKGLPEGWVIDEEGFVVPGP